MPNPRRLCTRKSEKPSAPLSETPVAQLSKILSKTNFTGAPQKILSAFETDQTSECIPADIDESANQEPPVNATIPWSENQDLITYEYSNSCSSGYFSSLTTQSAPPLCDYAFNFPPARKDNVIFTGCGQAPQTIVSLDPSATDGQLRRTYSCANSGWLSKRQRRHQQWPRISGILRNKSTNESMSLPSSSDTNSCPAVVCEADSRADMERQHELRFAENFSAFDVSPPRRRFMRSHEVSRLDSLCNPESKRQRICPSSHLDSPNTTPLKHLDTTLPVADELVAEVRSESLAKRSDLESRPHFALLRHHSTPMSVSQYMKRQIISPTFDTLKPEIEAPRPSLPRCISDPPAAVCDKLARYINALDNRSLRCDGRRARALPVVDRMASGLHCVSTDTVAKLLLKPKEDLKFIIVDCRYPYEYDGGHIQNAINIFTHSDLVQEVFNRVPAERPPGCSGPPRLLGEYLNQRLAVNQGEPLPAQCDFISDDESLESEETDDSDESGNNHSDESDTELAENIHTPDEGQSSKTLESPELKSNMSDIDNASGNSSDSGSHDAPFAVIFHCEFSSQRAPELAAFLRNMDRTSNYHRYPFLYFPEVYVMKGGYSEFYRKFPNLCYPRSYVKMFHRDYRSHLRLYKRLTRRVGTACQACIRPQAKGLGQLDPSATELDSFGRPTEYPLKLLVPNEGVLLSESGLVTSPLLQAKISPIPANNSLEDKENQSVALEPVNKGEESVAVGDSPSYTPVDYDIDESPLNLAERIIRVGRRVISATLYSADPSKSEVARALDRFKQRILTPPKQVNHSQRPSLKRSVTSMAFSTQYNTLHEQQQFPQRRSACCPLPLLFDDNGNSMADTPAAKKACMWALNTSPPIETLRRTRSNWLELASRSPTPDTPITSVNHKGRTCRADRRSHSADRSLSASSD